MLSLGIFLNCVISSFISDFEDLFDDDDLKWYIFNIYDMGFVK